MTTFPTLPHSKTINRRSRLPISIQPMPNNDRRRLRHTISLIATSLFYRSQLSLSISLSHTRGSPSPRNRTISGTDWPNRFFKELIKRTVSSLAVGDGLRVGRIEQRPREMCDTELAALRDASVDRWFWGRDRGRCVASFSSSRSAHLLWG